MADKAAAPGAGASPGQAPKVVRGPYRNGIRRRREIIESAAHVFGTYGYAGGSLRQIAQEVGVTPAALARHFDSKEGLLVAVLEYWDEENDRLFPKALHGLSRFKQMLNNVEHHTHDRGLIEMFLTVTTEASNPSHPANDYIRRRYDRVISNGIAQLTRARDEGEVEWMSEEQIAQEVRGVYSLMDGVQLQWLLDPSMDLIGTFRRCLGEIISRWTGGRPVEWLPPDAAETVDADDAAGTARRAGDELTTATSS